ncbi:MULTISPECIES: ubiquitin-like small modifier protein 1 [Halorussus]|uniref:ubiquitin-like small modifier protein 1 n=1 Tax=Halorussus TaxID=1070314 RepID=UPI000E217489|nr:MULTISPECIES: ubiquitin-like small modifier protein 1 [Halorussus]NHN59921.1 MoaD/ThiS family protein [Halorussus sp. JP-T4]
MEWKLFADLAEIAGGKRVDVDADPGETVGAALAALVADHPGLEDRIYDEEGDLRDHINVLRNGTNVHAEDGLDTELDDGDELALFPPVSGGSVTAP